MNRIIKVQNTFLNKNIDYNFESYNRVNNIVFLLDEAIFTAMDINIKISKLVSNDSYEILNAIRMCPASKEFIFNSYMSGKLKNNGDNKIEFLNIDNVVISIKDLKNIFIIVHDNYKADKIIEPKFYNDFHKEESILDYIINIYELNEPQKKMLFKILDNITSVSQNNIKLFEKLFLELKNSNNDKIKNSSEILGNYKKEKLYIPKLLEMKDLVDNKNLLKVIKNKFLLFEKYKKIIEELLSLLPLNVINDNFPNKSI